MPRWRIMIFDSSDVEIKDTWHTTGMAGSGSNHYSVADAFVPERHTFSIFEPAKRSEALYSYHGLFFANVPGIPLGLGRDSIYRGHPLERIRRDIMAVNTHIVHSRKTYATVGKMLLGGPGGLTMF
jgi:hypothetical protein